MKFPRGPFSCVAADPAWSYRTFSSKGQKRGAQRHYNTMTLDQIKALPVAASCARDAHLFMWATGPMLREAFEVMDAWGFKYSSMAFVWIKLNKLADSRQFRFVRLVDSECFFGMGHTTRQNAEFVLLGRRGKPTRLVKTVRQVIVSPLREHSRKPDEFFDRVESYCDGPRLEMFSRTDRPGWSAWGDELGKFRSGR